MFLEMECQEGEYLIISGSNEVAECRSRAARFVTVRDRTSNKLAGYLELKFLLDTDDDSMVCYMYF